MNRKITIAIVGLGSRGKDTYAKCTLKFPDEMEIVAIADTSRAKVDEVATQYHIQPEMCFNSAEELLQQDRLADVLFLCTMDRQHGSQAVAALRKGYHLLLEKPISPKLEECREIVRVAKECDRQVAVCHVLRYTPFYQKLKSLIQEKAIGDVVSIQAIENVGYWHQAHSFVRGNWRNAAQSSPMILQKCSHDMDILIWLVGKNCKHVSSFGALRHFKPECAPEGSAERCLDCGVKANCPYDAEKIYITNEATGVLHGHTEWPNDVLALHPTEESIRAALRTGPYGRCVYRCDNDVVDHQVVNMEMEDDTTINFTMCGLTESMTREIYIMGTKGNIRGNMRSRCIEVQPFGGEPEVIDVTKLATDFSGHGGGDHRLVHDFIQSVANHDQHQEALTSIEQSAQSHFVALAAEYSRLHHGESVEIETFAQL